MNNIRRQTSHYFTPGNTNAHCAATGATFVDKTSAVWDQDWIWGTFVDKVIRPADQAPDGKHWLTRIYNL
jgi:hypothetical protein